MSPVTIDPGFRQSKKISSNRVKYDNVSRVVRQTSFMKNVGRYKKFSTREDWSKFSRALHYSHEKSERTFTYEPYNSSGPSSRLRPRVAVYGGNPYCDKGISRVEKHDWNMEPRK